MLTEYNTSLQSQTNFTVNVLSQIINSNEGLSFSPYSLTLALAMCFIGAGGKTKIEFKNLLSPNVERTEYLEFLENSINDIYFSSTKGTNIYVANKLFIQNSYIVNDKFKEDLEKYLKASLENVDFRVPTTAAKTINDFVKKNTHGKISNVINFNSINENTKAILVNALYFKGQWEKKFDKELTRDDDFFTTSTKKKTVKMMNRDGELLYGSDKNFHVVKLSYSNNNSSFVIVLPKKKNTLHTLFYKYNFSNLLNLIRSTQRKKVTFSMPKFKVESEYEFRKTLIKMRLSSAFDDSANFTSMTPKNDFKIDEVVQKVFVDVNEQGTEAAAATSVRISRLLMYEEPFEEIVVKANHPFLYFILNNDNILINGIYQ